MEQLCTYCQTPIQWSKRHDRYRHAWDGPRNGSVFCDDNWTTVAEPSVIDERFVNMEGAETKVYVNGELVRATVKHVSMGDKIELTLEIA